MQQYALFAKYLYTLSKGKALNLEGRLGQSKSDDDTETLTNTNLELSADYYFNRRLSAGAGIEKSSGDNEYGEGMNFSANVRYFITPWFSVQASHERFNYSNEGLGSDRSYEVSLAARF